MLFNWTVKLLQTKVHIRLLELLYFPRCDSIVGFTPYDTLRRDTSSITDLFFPSIMDCVMSGNIYWNPQSNFARLYIKEQPKGW